MPPVTNNHKKITIDVSSLTLVKILIIIVAMFFLFYIRGVLMLVFIALILASAFDPIVDWLQRKRLPRALGILIIYLCLFGIVFIAVDLIIAPISSQLKEFSQDLPVYWDKLMANWRGLQDFSEPYGLSDNIQGYLVSVQNYLGEATGNAVGGIFSFLGGILSFFLIMVMTFYFVIGDQAIKNSIRSLLPPRHQPYFTHLVNRMQDKIGLWLRGQLILCLVIFVLTWVGLTALGVKYALVLALFAGVMEIIPYLGPLLSAIPALLIAFVQSPILGLVVVIFYFVLQQLENYFIFPTIMQKAVGLNPIVVIIAMLIGAQLAGIWGILLAIPVATAIGVFWGDVMEQKKKKDFGDK